jgi:hypothetical protein
MIAACQSSRDENTRFTRLIPARFNIISAGTARLCGSVKPSPALATFGQFLAEQDYPVHLRIRSIPDSLSADGWLENGAVG